MRVHAIMLNRRHRWCDGRPADPRTLIYPPLDQHITAELAREHNQRAVKQAALAQVPHETGNRPIDERLHLRDSLMAVFMRVPVSEWLILGVYLDEARARFDQ